MTFHNIWKKITTISVGHAGAEALNHIFDVLLYPVTIWFLGPFWSFLVLVPLSLLWDYGVILIYNQTSHDWWGFEALRRKAKSPILIGLLFVFFSWWDPPRAFALVRGRHLNRKKFDRNDWKWFFSANLIGNVMWIVMLTGIFEIIRNII